MRLVLIFSLITLSVAHSQNCRLEAIENDKKLFIAGEFKGQAMLTKMQSLVKEIKTLSSVKYSGAQKNAMRFCLQAKDGLFQELMLRPDPEIQDNPYFQETMAEYKLLHEDFQEALGHIDHAIRINPKDLSLLLKNLHIYARANKVSLEEIADKPLAKSETERIFSEISRRSARIIEHPDTTKELALEGLGYQARIAKALNKPEQEMMYLEKIIALDPNNLRAHQRRLEYFVSTNQITSAIETMRKMSRDKLATDKNWEAFLILLSKLERWDDFVSWTQRAPNSLIESQIELKMRLARAYLELGRSKDAEKIMQNLPKDTKGTALTIAKENRARLHELTADSYKQEGRLSEALDEYKKALAGGAPRPLTVKEKISLLIYEYRKGLNFKPIEATQKDLQEVISLLKDSVYKTELKSNLFTIYFHSLEFNSQLNELKKACERFKKVYPELLKSKDYLKYCQQEAKQPIPKEDVNPLNNNRQL